jgi:hypothetical protein
MRRNAPLAPQAAAKDLANIGFGRLGFAILGLIENQPYWYPYKSGQRRDQERVAPSKVSRQKYDQGRGYQGSDS